MEAGPKINVASVIDNSPIGSFQIVLLALCAACLVMDGFDVQALGFVAPAITEEWQIPPSALGTVFGAGNFGVLLGSVLFTMLADKIGRRPVLIAATFFFSIMSFLTALAGNASELLVFRFIAGLGMGSIVPNASALVSEYSPRRHRVTLIMSVTVGFTAGAALGGFVAAWLIPAFGWRSVFYAGGAIPLGIAFLMLFWLPESPQFLTLRGRKIENVRKWLLRLDPSLPVNATFVVLEENNRGVPALLLFREGRASATLMLWVVNFMNILNLYFLSNWLPTVVRNAGYSTTTAVLVGTTLQVGGTLGTFGLAWIIARAGFNSVLSAGFVIASISIAIIGQPGLALAPLFAVVFVAGWCVVGGQPGLNALAATFYPTYLRSTGVGWCLGIGRIGAIVGPVLGGQFMAMQWSMQTIFMAAAIPALISAIVMFSLRLVMKPQEGAVADAEAKAVMTH